MAVDQQSADGKERNAEEVLRDQGCEGNRKLVEIFKHLKTHDLIVYPMYELFLKEKHKDCFLSHSLGHRIMLLAYVIQKYLCQQKKKLF